MENASWLVLVIAVVIGCGVYMGLRNNTIATKGVDVEGFLSYLFSIPAGFGILFGLAFMFVSGGEATVYGIPMLIVGLVLSVLNALRFAKKIGIVSAIVICILQGISFTSLDKGTQAMQSVC